jgi:hypothetical protein
MQMCAAAMNEEEIARLAFRHVVRSEALGMDVVVTRVFAEQSKRKSKRKCKRYRISVFFLEHLLLRLLSLCPEIVFAEQGKRKSK